MLLTLIGNFICKNLVSLLGFDRPTRTLSISRPLLLHNYSGLSGQKCLAEQTPKKLARGNVDERALLHPG